MGTRRAVLAGALSAAVLAVAGCGGTASSGIPSAAPPSGGARASAGSPSGASTASSTAAIGGGAQAELAGYVSHQRAWVACMRQHAIDLPDPDRYGVVSVRQKSKGYLDAYLACRSLVVPMPASVQQLQRPKLTAAEIRQMVALAKCMQTHGMPSYPDPGSDGYTATEKEQQIDETSGAWAKAHAACQSIVPAPSTTGTPRG